MVTVPGVRASARGNGRRSSEDDRVKPITTRRTNHNFGPPRPTVSIGDLPCEIVNHDNGTRQIVSVWELSDEERTAIANGLNIRLLARRHARQGLGTRRASRRRVNRQFSEADAGPVHVEVDARAALIRTDLPEWLDTRKIADAAIAEYSRQRAEAVGELPTRATSELF